MRVSVNIVAQQLQRGNFVETIDRILERHQVDPRWLELEITESSLMDGTAQVKEILNEIKQRHISIALDDFGTGYSSLSYLKRLRADSIKIDQSFVQGILEDTDDLTLVGAIIALAGAFGRHVVAEGVETPEQAAKLLELGCERAQGLRDCSAHAGE